MDQYKELHLFMFQLLVSAATDSLHDELCEDKEVAQCRDQKYDVVGQVELDRLPDEPRRHLPNADVERVRVLARQEGAQALTEDAKA